MADSSAAQILARLKVDGHGAAWVASIMRQEGKPQPRAKLDAIADGLADIVISSNLGAPTQRTQDLGVDALLALAGAGNPGPNSYDGSLDRLIRIHKEASSRAALYWLTAVPGSERALAYLREVAVSSSPTAWSAISALITEAKSGGYAYNPEPSRREAQDILRDLFQRDLVKETVAARDLLVYGHAQGWKRND